MRNRHKEEIERKFKLFSFPEELENVSIVHICEAHFHGQRLLNMDPFLLNSSRYLLQESFGRAKGDEIYAEMMRSAHLRVRATIQGHIEINSYFRIGAYGSMKEHKLAVNNAANEFLQNPENVINKKRRNFRDLRIDVYEERNLVLAEITLPKNQIPEVPQWLLPYIEREVTDDPRYYHDFLACYEARKS